MSPNEPSTAAASVEPTDPASRGARPATPQPGWVELALFYGVARRVDEDPADVVDRGIILYGEGMTTETALKDSVRRESLGDGLHVLHVTGSWSNVRKRLLEPHFDLRHSQGKKTRFRMGFIERPPILGRPTKTGAIGSVGEADGSLILFVRKGKAAHVRDLDDRGRLLDRLDKLVSRQLRADDVAWLGDVAVISKATGRIWWKPVRREDPRAPCRAITLHRSPELAGQAVDINVRVSAQDRAIIDDRLVTLEAQGPNEVRVDLNQPVGLVHLRAWVGGALVAESLAVLGLTFAFTVTTGGGSVRLKDKLYDKLYKAAASSQSARNALETETVAAREGFKTQSTTGVRPTDWDFARHEVGEVFDVAPPNPADNTFFAVGAEGRARAINFFARTLSKAGQSTIADPWFDAEAAAVLLPRLSTPEVDLTVVTSLPVDDRGLAEGLRAMLAKLRPAQKLRVIRVTCGGGQEPAFHDRVVIVDGGDQPPRGLLLSNSFSGMASLHPLAVAELPPGTTAVFIDLIAGLISGDQGVAFEQLWPPADPPAPARDMHAMYFFPQWRLYLAIVHPASSGLGRDPLAAAANAGLLTLKEERRPHWGTSERNRTRILERLLPGRARPPSRLRRRERRRRAPRLNYAEGLLFIGELRARGLTCSLDEFFARFDPHDVGQFVRALRETFSAPESPEVRDALASDEEMGLRQLMAARTATTELLEAVAARWLQGLWTLPDRRWHWGRQLLYAALCRLDPRAAVRTAETLLDVDFLRALFGNLSPTVERWPGNLTDVLLASNSAALRAIGCFAAAHLEDRGGHGNHLTPPDDVGLCLRRLRNAGVADVEVARVIALWADCPRGGAKLADLARGLASLEGLLADNRRDFASSTLRAPVFVRGYVDHLRSLPSPAARRAEPVLEAMTTAFAAPLRCEFERGPTFTAVVDLERTRAAAAVVAELANMRGASVEDVVSSAVDLPSLRVRALEPLTPLRSRPGALDAELAFGWALLWMACACAEPSSDLLSSARQFLARPGRAYLRELREELGSALGLPREATDTAVGTECDDAE